jgi:predicted RNase H-like nuclease
MLASRVAGVDAALGGWIAVILDGEGFERAELGRAPVDDIVDAGIAAWTARRIASGLSKTLPADPSSGEPTITY